MDRSTTEAEEGQWKNVEHRLLTQVIQTFKKEKDLFLIKVFTRQLHLEKMFLLISTLDFFNNYDHVHCTGIVWIMIKDLHFHTQCSYRSLVNILQIHPWSSSGRVLVVALVGYTASNNFRFMKDM